MQTVILKDTNVLGSIPVEQFLQDDLAELVLPSSLLLRASLDEIEVPSDPRFQIAKHMNNFIYRFAQVRISSKKS